MRPRKLRIEGFTCYREPVEIDFTDLDVFVISGPTGSGKTTIIDAMCYALYGEVPRETRVGDLISRGAPGVQVQLEFDAGGRRYRVHRGVNVTRSTNKKTGAEKVTRDISPVQFEEQRDGEWAPVADRVDDVDAAIADAVGLDFDSFTRCVLLPQGQFAEFLAGDRGQRRTLLIDLLDIGIYERIMRRANARANEFSNRVQERERQLRDDYADATDEALASAREQISAAKPQLVSAQERRGALQDAQTHATTAAAAYQSENARRDELKKTTANLDRAQSEAGGATKKLAELDTAAKVAAAELKVSAYDSALHAALARANELARQLERARATATQAQAAANDRAIVAQSEAAAKKADAEHDAARTAVASAQAALDDAQRHESAAHVRAGLEAGDTCPVCGNAVGKLPKGEKPLLDAARKKLDAAKTAETKALATAARASNAFAVARKDVETAAERAKTALAEATRCETDLKASLPKGMKAEPAAIASKLEEQSAAQRAYEALSQESTKRANALQAHKESMAASEQAIAHLKGQAVQLNTQIDEAVAQRKLEAAAVKKIAAVWHWPEIDELIEAQKSPAAALKSMLDASQQEAETLTSTIAKLEADADRIEKAIKRAAALRDELAAMKVSWQLNKELGTLLRADNFQEFVIVEAMQVLASAASEHLKTLYDRFAIAVDGSEFTVIDHWEAGQARPAKTLSGGETFVASLALALALSERLPELRSAAAARLESLFLDEGFGTLDRETLNDVIEALEGLRSQERMVGIITHVPELAQRVEHRIDVRKSPEGSTIFDSKEEGGRRSEEA